ncbi:MAG: sensor histidine kinase, partial [Planctomycetota bacterium]
MVDDQLSYSARAALAERVKELTCLYGIAQISGQPDTSLDEVLQSIVELLPAAWQYPEIASARITLDDTAYETPGFREGPQKQTADIVVSGSARGAIEIVYVEQK